MKGNCKKCGHLIEVPGQTETIASSAEADQKQLVQVPSLKSGRRPSSRFKVFISVLIIACFVLLGFFGWRWYINRPQYAIKQIRDAILSSNRLRFERYVDVNRFSQDLVDEIFEGAIQTSFSDVGESGWAILGNLLGRKLVESVKPALVGSVKSAIAKAVSAGDFKLLWEDTDSVSTDFKISPSVLAKNSGLTADSNYHVGKIEKDGDRAYLPIHFRNEHLDTTLTIRIDMRRENNDWRVVGVEDLSEYIIETSNLQKARLISVNNQIKHYLSTLVEI